MENHREESEAETISDIQNYLASFNKEIQDGTSVGGDSLNQQSENSEMIATTTIGTVNESGQQETTTGTYYVTQTADGYQYTTDQNQNAYNAATYYTSSGTTYYASTEQQGQNDQNQGQYETIHTYTTVEGITTDNAMKSASGTDTRAARMVTAVTAGENSSFQQIMLAVDESGNLASREMVDGNAQEISVTIPASMTGTMRHIHHETTEELLKAVENQNNSTETTQALDQPTFVAMQPGTSHDNQTETANTDNQQGLAALISQAEGESGAQQHTIRMVLRQPDGMETEQTIPVSSMGGSTLVTSDGQEIHVSDEGTLQMVANLAEQAASGTAADGNNQVILNAGNSYQTVTIVPSDTNPGEVSYVLIVSQSEDGKDDCQKDVNLDMSVYDFNEAEKHGEVVAEETGPDGIKMRTIRITTKKSQTVTQAHMCNYCNYTSPKRYLLSRHMKSHSEERPHKCSVCERGFKTLASLQNHVNTHTGTRPHQCKECEAAFTTSGELVRHVRYKHTHEKPHRCTECDYASVELSKLKRHMRCHTGERPYQCLHCTYASPDTYKLKRHLRIHTGEKPYECDVCHARFTQSNSLKAHKLIHSGNKPVFQCNFCPTTCGRKTDLRIHVQKLHTSDKPLKCKRCGKSFPDRYNYKVHVKTHEGEKCFKCDLCSYASISQRHLESHMLIHTDQKPFHCDECDQSFRQKQLLKRHKNLYHDPNYIPPIPKEKTHECPECGKAFRHKGNLIRHMAIHDPDASAAERAEALRIGQPKGPGEQRDGEEEDYEEMEEMTVDVDVQNQQNQQVVVFEVIQLPTSDGSDEHQQSVGTLVDGTNTVTMTSNGEAVTSQINSNLTGQVVTAISSGEDNNALADLITSGGTIEELVPVTVTSQITPNPPRRRGRPRKYPLPNDVLSNTVTPPKVKEEKIDNTYISEPRRSTRKRKVVVFEELDEIDRPSPPTPSRRGRPPKHNRNRNLRTIEVEDDQSEIDAVVLPASVGDPEILARREQELARKRLEQKQKDMAECFGFNDDDEEAETILAMPVVPGTSQSLDVIPKNHNEADSNIYILTTVPHNGTSVDNQQST